VNLRKIKLIDSIDVGISINSDGNLFMSPANFQRMFPDRKSGSVDLGLIQLRDGANAEVVRDQLAGYVGKEAKVLTREQLIDAEIVFIRENAPIDFILAWGCHWFLYRLCRCVSDSVHRSDKPHAAVCHVKGDGLQ
jgi:putative ABC transport system permease protein